MSIIHPNTIKAIAHSVDIPKLADDAAKTLAPDVEYRLREVVQEALKFAKHAKRTKLTTEDINDALRLRNVEPLFGFISRDPAKFLRVATHPDVFYVRDPELNYHELIETPLPKLPREAGVAIHWLAINGVQPELPENTPVEQPPAKRQKKAAATAQKPAGQDAVAAGAGMPGLEAHPGALAITSTIPSAAGAAAAAATGQRLGQAALLNSRAAAGAAAAAVQLQLPVRHTLSRELQVYGDKLVGLLLAQPTRRTAAGGSSYTDSAAAAAAAAGGAAGVAARELKAEDKHAVLLRAALASVASDPGLHPLAPYLCAFIAEKVAEYLDNLELLKRLLQLARALLSNPAVHLEPYLQQLLPAVLTCVVTKRMGSSPLDDHWSVRREAAALLAAIAAQFSAPHHNLRPRLCRVLAQTFLDASKPLTSKYGAVVGLQALGPQVVRTLLVPHLEPFMTTCLLPAMHTADSDVNSSSSKSQSGPNPPVAAGTGAQQLLQQQQKQQQMDAWQVYAAVLSAVGGAMYDLLIGQLEVPQSLVLARRGQQVTDWESEYTKALLAAKRPVAVRLAVKQDGQGVQLNLQVAGAAAAAGHEGAVNGAAAAAGHEGAGNGAAAASTAAADGSNTRDVEMTEANGTAEAAGGSSSGKPDHIWPHGLLQGGGQASSKSSKSKGQLSIAQVLGESWKEDSDVNATLGALMHLFGEDLLPHLPLAQLAAVSL